MLGNRVKVRGEPGSREAGRAFHSNGYYAGVCNLKGVGRVSVPGSLPAQQPRHWFREAAHSRLVGTGGCTPRQLRDFNRSALFHWA